ADRRAARMATLSAAAGYAGSVGTRDAHAPKPEGSDDEPAPVGMALEPYLDGLFGGDRDKGRAIFERPSLSCAKCHATDEDGKQIVGPNLHGVGHRLARLTILESIVAPNRRIAPGYGSELLFLKGGETLAGRVLQDDAAAPALKVTDKDGNLRLVPRADIELRKPSLSPMPEG